MNAKTTSQAATETLDVAITSGGTIELVAVITAMVFAACAAAALLLTTPAVLQSAANAAPIEVTQASRTTQRTFHERYAVSAAAESIDAPTF